MMFKSANYIHTQSKSGEMHFMLHIVNVDYIISTSTTNSYRREKNALTAVALSQQIEGLFAYVSFMYLQWSLIYSEVYEWGAV